MYLSLRFEDIHWCWCRAASGSPLSYYRCALFAILKPKNRKKHFSCTILLFIPHSIHAVSYSLQGAAFEEAAIAPILRRQKTEIAALHLKEAKAKKTIDLAMAARRAEQLARY